MGSPNLRLVRQTIRTHLLDSLPDDVTEAMIQPENRAFSVTPNSLYIRETQQVYYEGARDLIQFEARGRTVFDIFVPANSGTEDAEDLAHKIYNAFEKKHGMSTEGITVGLDRVERRPGAEVDDGWWMNSIIIYWRTYADATSPTAKTG